MAVARVRRGILRLMIAEPIMALLATERGTKFLLALVTTSGIVAVAALRWG